MQQNNLASSNLSPPPHSLQSAAAMKEIHEKSSLISRNVTVANHRTSVRLEPEMWNGLREICHREHLTIHDIATAISLRKPSNTSLTAAMRVFVMAYFRAAATEDGHNKAGHGPGGSFMASWGHPVLVSNNKKSQPTHNGMLKPHSIVSR